MLPNRPVNTVNAAVSPGEPPIQPDKSTATEAVTDLGNADFIISSDPPSSATQSALIPKPAALPIKAPINSAGSFERRRSACLYKGTASATVAGPRKKVTMSPPALYPV